MHNITSKTVQLTFRRRWPLHACFDQQEHTGDMPQEMAAVCKPDGRLLLLEHGRATSDWVNRKLDGEAERHCAKFGCHWNRPILDIVAEARHAPWHALRHVLSLAFIRAERHVHPLQLWPFKSLGCVY